MKIQPEAVFPRHLYQFSEKFGTFSYVGRDARPARPLRLPRRCDPTFAPIIIGNWYYTIRRQFLDRARKPRDDDYVRFWGRTGFDLGNAPEAACRGWFVGLVKNRTKQNS